MEGMTEIGIALVIGLVIGYLVAAFSRGKPRAEAGSQAEAEKDWWEIRKTLTGTQLQILQHMESNKQATIGSLQEKFSFIPDRELFYRLEQIVLMGFVDRGREDGDVIYKLNAGYSGTVEDDKTVMLPND
ncbi:MAG: hypothetical protein KDI19_06215 [Pseudomonadales bacterium]|nr:hypothetical protein [Pseudomonadales bacterium]